MKIHNGDHLEYELANKDTPLKERSDWPFPSFDARDWAEAFCERNPSVDVGVALSWFANALMRGYDEAACKLKAEQQRLDTFDKNSLRIICAFYFAFGAAATVAAYTLFK
jgi:hypothetical protein